MAVDVLLMSVEVCWCIVDVCWCLLMSVDVLLMSVDVCWCLLMSVDVCWFCWCLLILLILWLFPSLKKMGSASWLATFSQQTGIIGRSWPMSGVIQMAMRPTCYSWRTCLQRRLEVPKAMGFDGDLVGFNEISWDLIMIQWNLIGFDGDLRGFTWDLMKLWNWSGFKMI